MKRKDKVYRIMFRRKREGRTNYKKRLNTLSSRKLRLVVRKSINNIQACAVDYEEKGDKIIACAHSKELVKLGWKYNTGNVPAAYLTGLLLGKKAKEKGIPSLVLDIGLCKSVAGSRLYAVLSGVVDGGIKVPHDSKILPTEERLSGKHITDFAGKIKDDKDKMQKQFGNYIKNNVDPSNIEKNFSELKNKLSGGKNG